MRNRFAVWFFTALAFTLPACGGDDDDGGTVATGTAGTAGRGGAGGSAGRGGAAGTGGTGGVRSDAGPDARPEGGPDGSAGSGGAGGGGGDGSRPGAINPSRASGDTREDGTKATFTVALGSQPSA